MTEYEKRSGIVFIGNMHHLPNQDAVAWYATAIHPLVRQAVPDAVFLVIGSPVEKIPEVVRANADSLGVRILGYVEDPRPVFDQALCSVAPLRFGAGVKGKIGQSLAYGVPAVTTPIGAEGLFLTEHNALIGSTPQEIADRIISLHRSKVRWHSFRKAGLRVIEERLSLNAAREELATLMELARKKKSCTLRRMTEETHQDIWQKRREQRETREARRMERKSNKN